VTIISDLTYLEAARRFAARYQNNKLVWTRKREDRLKDLHAIGLDPAIISVELEIGEQLVRRRLKMLGLARR
jgi:hypothetical protein